MRNAVFTSKRGRFISCPGSSKHQLYSSYYDEAGVLRLDPVGVEDTDEIIESFRASTELSVIIARFLNGDTTALDRQRGFYADLTNAPKTMRDALDIVMKAEGAFNALPVDVRKEFGNDWQAWLAQSGSEEWTKIMQPFNLNTHANNDLNDNARANNNEAASSLPSDTSS